MFRFFVFLGLIVHSSLSAFLNRNLFFIYCMMRLLYIIGKFIILLFNVYWWMISGAYLMGYSKVKAWIWLNKMRSVFHQLCLAHLGYLCILDSGILWGMQLWLLMLSKMLICNYRWCEGAWKGDERYEQERVNPAWCYLSITLIWGKRVIDILH